MRQTTNKIRRHLAKSPSQTSTIAQSKSFIASQTFSELREQVHRNETNHEQISGISHSLKSLKKSFLQQESGRIQEMNHVKRRLADIEVYKNDKLRTLIKTQASKLKSLETHEIHDLTHRLKNLEHRRQQVELHEQKDREKNLFMHKKIEEMADRIAQLESIGFNKGYFHPNKFAQPTNRHSIRGATTLPVSGSAVILKKGRSRSTFRGRNTIGRTHSTKTLINRSGVTANPHGSFLHDPRHQPLNFFGNQVNAPVIGLEGNVLGQPANFFHGLHDDDYVGRRIYDRIDSKIGLTERLYKLEDIVYNEIPNFKDLAGIKKLQEDIRKNGDLDDITFENLKREILDLKSDGKKAHKELHERCKKTDLDAVWSKLDDLTHQLKHMKNQGLE
jgi:hypothetical protein